MENRPKVSEEKIVEMAHETDKFMASQVVKFKDEMHPLEVSAILFSRIIMMCRSIGVEQQFKNLATAALNMQEPEPLIKDDQKPTE